METPSNAGNVQQSSPQEQVSVTTVTDDALSSAWDNAQGADGKTEGTVEVSGHENGQVEQTGDGKEGAEEVGAGEEAGKQGQVQTADHDDSSDNADRSRLGRRLKSVEDGLNKLLERLDAVGNASQQTQQTQPQSQSQNQQQPQSIPDNVTFDDSFIQEQINAAVERGDLPETIITPHDQFRVNQFVNSLQAYMGNQYATKYLGMLKTPDLRGDTPDDIHAEVLAELQRVESPFNLRRYDNPVLDARLNYLEAKNSILTKRLSTGNTTTTVFKGRDKDGAPTGNSVTTRTTTTTDDLPTLDEASQDFIRRTGMSVDSVKSALKGDIPFNLRGLR